MKCLLTLELYCEHDTHHLFGIHLFHEQNSKQHKKMHKISMLIQNLEISSVTPTDVWMYWSPIKRMLVIQS